MGRDDVVPVYNQGDINSAILDVNITQDEVIYNLTNSTLSVFFKKDDGTVVYQDITNGVTITDAINGKISVSLNTQTLSYPGKVVGSIKIQNGTTAIETKPFYIYVEKSLTSDQALASNNELSPLLGTATLTTIAKDIKGSINEVNASLAEMSSQNNNTITYGYDSNGNVQTITEKDPSNNVIQTVTYTYNASGDVATSVTVSNGKTVTTTYNYDANGNITSTSNVLS